MVACMAENKVEQRHILLSLKKHNPGNLSILSQVYSYVKKYCRSQRGPLTEMQHLIKLLQGGKYKYWERRQPQSDVCRYIFWSHPDAIGLFNTFPNVFVLENHGVYKLYKDPVSFKYKTTRARKSAYPFKLN
ncbi:uncharacterized protein LOC130719564 [Lotus japonicus]|uniref:uncharacterized protein LOC130719564 n=1 Tax=Lotus japonicus TaxID=34305 RepID=UPI0025894F18|nr:uncharacterized protein LOC130719564 [Lotus japonicus]